MATFPIALSQVHSDNVGMHDPCLPARGCPRNRFLSVFPRLTQYRRTRCSVVRRATAERSQGREFLPAHGLPGMHGGSFPNGHLLQFLLAAAEGPSPCPIDSYPNARGGKEKARKMTRRARLRSLSFWKPGRLRWGLVSLSRAHVLMCPFLCPLPLAPRSRCVPELLLATVHNATSVGPKGITGI